MMKSRRRLTASIRSRTAARKVIALAALLASLGALAEAAPRPAPPSGDALRATPVLLPGGSAGIGFDDLRFSSALARVLVPAGRSGNLDLVDPASHRIEAIAGFSARPSFVEGHGEGTTSADSGRGWIFAIDRTALELVVVDAAKRAIVARAHLASAPDYVRWVEPTREVWVTQPEEERIEIFALGAGATPTPTHVAFLAVPGGPESLVVDPAHGRAYTNLWRETTLALDVARRSIVARWPNTCKGARGIAIDGTRGFLFVGCAEGRAVVLDLAHDGRMLDSLRAGEGVDIIDYSSRLAHLYLPGGASRTMALLGVASTGKLTLLGTVETAPSAHCVVADDRGQAWVCDPGNGRLLLVPDPYPASN